ncbi:hypothetical protein DMB44_08095 [Thermoplasma sp. Kam2015]|uniref:hypothetical protein n=1 Tax=Thermoplasma sp. Kam2015 TaxID=2094122 RepID=UPI000D98EF83|nr:hypothetical protein [Thermoplasma sp. Kam2015]PYB67676.1 hypothetical protein DMB44_08095 [Thermoplasma sp. Kam2015]
MTNKSVQASMALNVFNGTGINVGNYSDITFTPYVINVSLSFSKKPIQVINASIFSNVNMSGQPNADPYCEEYQFDYYTYAYDTYQDTVWQKNMEGMFPLLLVHLSKNVSSGLSGIVYSGSVMLINADMYVNGNEVYKPVSGEATSSMSTSPSTIILKNFTFTGGISQNVVMPYDFSIDTTHLTVSQANNNTTGYVAINNATYTIVHYDQYTSEYKTKWHEIVLYEYVDGKYAICHVYKENEGTSYVGTTYDGNGSKVYVSSIQTTNGELVVKGGTLPNNVADAVSYIMRQGSTLENYDLNVSASLESTTLWYREEGYSTAADEIAKVNNAVSTFNSALGLGLALITAISAGNAFDFDLGVGEEIVDAASLMSSYLGLELSLVADFTSISFFTSLSAASVMFGLTNKELISPGSNYVLSDYSSYMPVSFTVNGNYYSFYAPEDYLNATSIIS